MNGLYQTKHSGNLAESISAEFRLKRASFDCLNGFYEKVTKVKADVAAVLVLPMQRFGEWW